MNKIYENLSSFKDFNDLKEFYIKYSDKFKGVKKYSFLAKIFRKIYKDPFLVSKFGEKKIYSFMLVNISDAVKFGDINTLSYLSFDDPSIEVLFRAMILMLDRTNNSCYALSEALKEAYPNEYIKKVKEIFGREVALPKGNIEDDQGHFRESPAILEFKHETIARMKLFLNKNINAENPYFSILSSALDVWDSVCDKTDCDKIYQKIYCMNFEGFSF